MTQKEKIMTALGVTEQEACDIIEYDKAIDKGADPFPLSAEQKQTEKKMRQADRKPTIYKLDNTNGKRSKKADDDKAFLTNALIIGLCNCIGMDANAEVEVINSEREFVFHYKGKKYKVVLSAPRS